MALHDIEAALATVQSILDALNGRGDHEAAYEVARAQYAASIRSSWPANLAQLLAALERVAADRANHLTDDERTRATRAVDVLRRVGPG